jgi:hypothetical protein
MGIIVVLLSVLFALLLGFIIFTTLHYFENEGIINDDLLDEYLNKLSDNYRVNQNKYFERIEPTKYGNKRKFIEKSMKLIAPIFPYYIEGVGIIPFWSKSVKRINAMFDTEKKNDWKREELGLD